METEEDVYSCVPRERLFAQIPLDPDVVIQPVQQPLQLRVTARTSLHMQRGAQSAGEVGRFAGAPSSSHTLPQLSPPCQLGGETSENELRREKPRKATQECVSAQLSSAAIRARQIPEQCLRKQGGLFGLRFTTPYLRAGEARSAPNSPGSPPGTPPGTAAPERHVAGPAAGPTDAAGVGGRERGGNGPVPAPTCGCQRPPHRADLASQSRARPPLSSDRSPGTQPLSAGRPALGRRPHRAADTCSYIL